MYTDIIDLREFYDSSLGQRTRRLLRRKIRAFWPDVRAMTVVGLGYATPYLGVLRAEAGRTIALMPAAQGCSPWPREGPGLVALSDETELPLPDMSVDRLLLVHALEGTEHLRPMMREIWRVMAGGARLLVVVPNRSGLWARADWTPFGHGNPYSASQLRTLLRDSLFVPERSEGALFLPPVRWRLLASMAAAWERFGQPGLATFAGVTLVEASKQIVAGVSRRVEARRLILPLPGRAAPRETVREKPRLAPQ